MNYGKLVKELREAKGISLRTLWEKSGVRDTTISHWENGGVPPVDKFEKVLAAMDETIIIGKTK